MPKLSDETIKLIQSADVSTSNSEVASLLGIDPRTVAKYRRQLWEALVQQKIDKEWQKKLKLLEHYSSKDIQEMLNYIAMKTKKEIDKVLWEPWHLRCWLIADTHIWSSECRLDSLHKFYEDAKAEWVECIFHAWDLVDWGNVYSWQQFEQDQIWYERQVDKVVKDYPNIWVPTFYIWWNHDFSFLKTLWADVCKTISTLRDDLVNLWYYDATININGIKIQLQHWGWSGNAYSGDYKLLKNIDTIKAWEEPDIFWLWHFHRQLRALHRWIHWFMPWSFLWPNMLAKRFRFPNVVGWWIIDITKDEEWKKKLTATFLDE